MPSKRSTSPANTEGVAGRQRLDEILLDLAEHAAAAASAGATARTPPARERTSRTFSMGFSTMVPTLRRYCWAIIAGWYRASGRPGLRLAWRSAHRSFSA
jgi:hypothetical protein